MLAQEDLGVPQEGEHSGDGRERIRLVRPQPVDGQQRLGPDPVQVAKRPRIERVGRVPDPLIHGVALDERIAGPPLVGQQPPEHEQRVRPLSAAHRLRESQDRPVREPDRGRSRVSPEDDVGVGHVQQRVCTSERRQRQDARQGERRPQRQAREVSKHG